MQTIYYVKGYNIYLMAEVNHVFKTERQAQAFATNLESVKIIKYTGQTIIDAINHIF